MKLRLSSSGRPPKSVIAASALVAASSLTLIGVAAQAAPARVSSGGTVLQTNLVSDLPGVAAVTDPNLVNAWGISESGASPFWISDNNAGVSTLYQVPGANNAPVTTVPLVVNIPTPVGPTGGTPTGTVFNFASGNGAFKVTGPDKNGVRTTAAAVFLFVTEDGTILGWNPGHRSHREVRRPGRRQRSGGHREGQLREQLHQPRRESADRGRLQGAGHRHQHHADHPRGSQQHGSALRFQLPRRDHRGLRRELRSGHGLAARRVHRPGSAQGLCAVQRPGSEREALRHLRQARRPQAR